MPDHQGGGGSRLRAVEFQNSDDLLAHRGETSPRFRRRWPRPPDFRTRAKPACVVFLNIQAALTLPGTLSTAEHLDQSRVVMCLPSKSSDRCMALQHLN